MAKETIYYFFGGDPDYCLDPGEESLSMHNRTNFNRMLGGK